MSNTHFSQQIPLNKFTTNNQNRNNNFYDRKGWGKRHDNTKKRFPPLKKLLLLQRRDQKGKQRGNTFQNDPSPALTNNKEVKNELKNVQFSRIIQNNLSSSIQKANAIGVPSSQLIYHAVGQSQRDKILGISPNPLSMIEENDKENGQK